MKKLRISSDELGLNLQESFLALISRFDGEDKTVVWDTMLPIISKITPVYKTLPEDESVIDIPLGVRGSRSGELGRLIGTSLRYNISTRKPIMEPIELSHLPIYLTRVEMDLMSIMDKYFDSAYLEEVVANLPSRTGSVLERYLRLLIMEMTIITMGVVLYRQQVCKIAVHGHRRYTEVPFFTEPKHYISPIVLKHGNIDARTYIHNYTPKRA